MKTLAVALFVALAVYAGILADTKKPDDPGGSGISQMK